MSELNFTVINHNARKKLHLTLIEYCFCDLLYNLSANNHSDYPGWCYATKDTLSDILGVSRREIQRMLITLFEKGLIEKRMDGRHIRTTKAWYDNAIIKKSAKMSQTVTDLHTHSDQMAHDSVTKWHTTVYNKDKVTKKTTSIRESDGKRHSLEEITDGDIERVGELYQVPVSFVRSKFEDLSNYCAKSGRSYKDYLAALRDFTKKDALKRKEAVNGISKIAIITPDPNWDT